MTYTRRGGAGVGRRGALPTTGAHLLPFSLVRTEEEDSEGAGWAPTGVVGGPKGLPPPALFFFHFPFFCKERKGEKRIIILGFLLLNYFC